SSRNLPPFDASCARRYDSRAYSSCASRENSYFDAHVSAQLPMCLSPYGSHKPSWIIVSIILPLPMRYPLRACGSAYGAFDIDSIPPATARSYSPQRMSFAAYITAFMPEPQTLLMVTAPALVGIPAPMPA